MRKDRNAFFQNAEMQAVNYMPNNMMPFQASSSGSSFYSGPNPNMIPNMNQELESRLAKIERQISRLNERVNKLESTTMYANVDDQSNSMYMI